MNAVGLVALGGVVACVWVTYRALTRDLRLRGAVRRRRATLIADARHGDEVKLVGRVIALDDQAEAPLSQRACVFVHTWTETIEVTSTINGIPIESWADGGQTHGGCDFLLEDDSGRALVKLTGDFEPLALLPPSRYVDFVNRQAGVRGKEAVICAGDRIAVVGTVTRSAPAGDGPFRAAERGAGAELVLSGSRASPVVLADL
jgi:hypothetical protein